MSEVVISKKLKMDLLEGLRHHNFDPVIKLMKLYDDAEIRYVEANGRMLDLADDASPELIAVRENAVHREYNNMLRIAELLMKFVYPQRKAISLQDNKGNDVLTTFADIVKKIHRDGSLNEAIDVTPKDSENG